MTEPAIGVCGLSCRLCPIRYAQAERCCPGCPSGATPKTACDVITCPHRGPGVQFCWECPEGDSCEIWRKHREFPGAFGHRQSLENNIRFIRRYGIAAFEKMIIVRERLLREMLAHYDEGQSTAYFCTAASTLGIGELETALTLAWETCAGMERSERSAVLRTLLDQMG